MYRLNALYAGMRFVGVPLRADFTLDVDAMLAAIAREQPALVWLAYPNNPTGNLFARARQSSASSRAAPGLVVVDEAYYAFADAVFLPRVLEFPNLVVRAHGVEDRHGRRCAWATRSAHPAWIAEFDKVRPPYNVNALTQAAAPVLLAARRRCSREQAAAIRARARRASPPRWRAARRHGVSDAGQLRRWCACRTRRAGSTRCATRASWSRTVDGCASAARATACASPSARRPRTTRCSRALARRSHERTMNAPQSPTPQRAQGRAQHRGDADRRRGRISTAPAAPSSRPACRSSTTCSTRSRATA